ncbi:MAG: hypothetical protein ACOX3D_04720 [Syntrophomonadales bacterium]
MSSLEHLLQPIKIRSMVLDNRVVIPPMGTFLSNEEGMVTEAALAYISRRVKSGAGLFIQEITAVHPNGRTLPSQLGIFKDDHIQGLTEGLLTLYSGRVRKSPFSFTTPDERACTTCAAAKPSLHPPCPALFTEACPGK